VKRDETRTEGVGVSSSDPLRPASRAQAARSAAPWLTPSSRARRSTFLFSKSRAESSAFPTWLCPPNRVPLPGLKLWSTTANWCRRPPLPLYLSEATLSGCGRCHSGGIRTPGLLTCCVPAKGGGIPAKLSSGTSSSPTAPTPPPEAPLHSDSPSPQAPAGPWWPIFDWPCSH
jgi:hypothetical protein